MEGRSEETKKKKRKKRVSVTMEAVTETADRIAPVVGYFPSGYDPLSSAAAGDEPDVRIFRNKLKSSRLELVVSPGSSRVEFVGKSYAGEAAGAQLCNYALGVFDKESRTLKIVPIATNKIFRLEPQLVKNQSAETEPSEGLAEEVLETSKVGQKIADLTNLYGTKKDRDKDKKWKSLNQLRNDPSSTKQLGINNYDSDMDNEVVEKTVVTTIRNIPPYDPSADIPEKAYLLDEIISKGERIYLLDILEKLESGEDIAAKDYPFFVVNRVHKLREIQDQGEKERLACILSYITHLQNFWERISSSRFFKSTSGSKSTDHRIPRVVYQKLLRMFVDQESNMLSAEKNELLIGYILVLTLFADSFQTDPTDIARDLKMPVRSLKLYYLQLGCKTFRESLSKPMNMILSVPLQFTDIRRRKKRRG